MFNNFLASSLLWYTFLLLNDLPAVDAVRIPITGQRVQRWAEVRGPAAGRLGHINRASISGSLDLQDQGDVKYFTNLTLGGQPFQVLIDTGSSDLWIQGSVPGAQDTGKTVSVNYAIGAVSGSVMTSTLTFDDFTVENQAFLNATQNSAGDPGILGLGPNSGSDIYEQFNDETGDTVLNRIFLQNTSTPNYITVLLGRSDDVAVPYPGDITIGQPLPTYENITSQPKLSVVLDGDSHGQHWQALLDKDGIIGPDGQPIQVQSVIEGLSQLVTVFDTGYTLPQVPAAVSTAIYARVPGANFTYDAAAGNVWTIPCDVELNVTFKFGGVSFPINPLDTNLNSFTVKNADGDTVCVGAFQPITTASAPSFDMILGMAFLRNAYILVDFGDFVPGSSSQANPYVQLLPLTTQEQGHVDFVQERLGGVDNTSALHLLPTPQTEYNGGTSSSESLDAKVKPYLPYIIAGSTIVAILLMVVTLYVLSQRRHREYQRLHDPAPVGLHYEQPPFPRYQRPHRRY
ncbi:uncharacterized protein FIBRA_03548 [Fibroporia radiculosa]|uniref:Peptidase A1 domain-containing protein n=1 Tax=Fibroporia radiculosa TaxID=599839 RepID=J4H2G7_9APHY|nr:uncharacterized protein FIBRA_03548 [Fibroporia radiculosa]CCM01494.1 predicted protein [Fibroporia radiculosa]